MGQGEVDYSVLLIFVTDTPVGLYMVPGWLMIEPLMSFQEIKETGSQRNRRFPSLFSMNGLS